MALKTLSNSRAYIVCFLQLRWIPGEKGGVGGVALSGNGPSQT